MGLINVLDLKSRAEFRSWLEDNCKTQKECYLTLKRGKPEDDGVFYYLDAVEEALCFGWIDSVQKSVDGVLLQRFSPRAKSSPWTELNKERVRRLEKLGLMRPEGRAVLPNLKSRFRLDADVEQALKEARVYSKFRTFPPLYQRVRGYNVAFYKSTNADMYQKALEHLIAETKNGKMFGQWNDWGRLLEYD